MKKPAKPKRIMYRREFIALAHRLGVREDWHEPDEQDVRVVVRGKYFDNAGFWPEELWAVGRGKSEKYIEIQKNRRPVAVVNLATLCAWAAGLEAEEV